MNPATPSSPPPQAPVPARAPVLDLGALHPAVAGSAPETWYDRTRRRVRGRSRRGAVQARASE